jgi:hypothetical protein
MSIGGLRWAHEPADIEPLVSPTGSPLPSPLQTNSLLLIDTPPLARPQWYWRLNNCLILPQGCVCAGLWVNCPPLDIRTRRI